MGFKTDREFLRNVSMGAIATRKISRVLNAGGFQIIELERYSSSNKIWATKLKRLRVPDLLCLRTGTRFEARGKSNLVVAMSHSENNEGRAWYQGLRDTDLVAIVLCTSAENLWKAADRVSLFRVGDLRATQQFAKKTRMKSADQGSEISLEWPIKVPGQPGIVTEVTADKITVSMDGRNRRQPYQLAVKNVPINLTPHVTAGDRVGAGDTIIASLAPSLVLPSCTDTTQYNFIPDLDSPDKETVYCAVKALGFLSTMIKSSREPLERLMMKHDDARIRLEAAASLTRLGVQAGSSTLKEVLLSDASDAEMRMEAVLILTEQQSESSLPLLEQVANTRSNTSELRAAATWGLAVVGTDPVSGGICHLASDEDELTAAHGIAGGSILVTEQTIGALLDELGKNDRQSGGIVRMIRASIFNPVVQVVNHIDGAGASKRQWLVYVLATLGRDKCEQHLKAAKPELLTEVEFFWKHQNENWTNRLDVADQIDALLLQLPPR